MAMVFQSYALYPYLSVAENIAFPLRMRERAEGRARASACAEAAEMLELEPTTWTASPQQLSGGQRQRVAMGRAIVREPEAFLMDEPLSNLDAKLRVQMRAEHRARCSSGSASTTVYVTHDQVEAMTMGHRIAVLRDGAPAAVDAPRAVYARPANLFVAGFIGSPAMNLVEAEVADGSVRAERRAARAAGVARVRREPARQGDRRASAGRARAGRARASRRAWRSSRTWAPRRTRICSADLPDGERRLIARVDSRRAPGQGECGPAAPARRARCTCSTRRRRSACEPAGHRRRS